MLKILILSIMLIAQPAHVSFMSVECFPDKGTIKVFVRQTHADFVFDYRFIVNDDQNFDPSGKIDTSEILVSRYLDNRLHVYADGKMLKGKITNIESTEGDLKWSLVYNYNKNAKDIKIGNTILTGNNKNPSNLLIFKYNDFEEGIKLTSDKTEYAFKVK